ncbi:hypothetical protein, partial [Candidatus Symbiothrix dinenymphae]|uniref:hypothetical protein n=1 Tax=Candidatus Symbiothrix dinenymphae TaxID=467085 RepID=UPI000A7905A8
FFAAIDKQVKAVLNSAGISPDSVKTIQTQFEAVKPTLSKLKLAINKLDTEKLSNAHKTEINKNIALIKSSMEIGEVDILSNPFFELLKNDETAFNLEQEKEQKEQKRKEREEAKRKEKVEKEREEKKEREEAQKEKERERREAAEKKAQEEKESPEREAK